MNANHKPTRQPGRPARGAQPAVRHDLVDAAEHLFTARGYAESSIRSIAEQAGVNPALISYHFGGKLGLLEAVFERALAPLAGALQALGDADGATPDDLLELLGRMGQEHPNLLPLLLREALLPSGALHETFIERFAPRLGGMFPALLRRAQAAGRLHEDVDPESLSVLILALGIFPQVASPLARRVLGIDHEQDDQGRLARQARQLLERGVRP